MKIQKNLILATTIALGLIILMPKSVSAFVNCIMDDDETHLVYGELYLYDSEEKNWYATGDLGVCDRSNSIPELQCTVDQVDMETLNETVRIYLDNSVNDTLVERQFSRYTNCTLDSRIYPWRSSWNAGMHIETGEGNDEIDGSPNADYIMGSLGSDNIYGWEGDDFLYGCTAGIPSNCHLDTGDNIYGDDGNDSIYGFAGEDYLHGGWGNDNIAGGDDDDFIDGWYGNDTIRGDTDSTTSQCNTADCTGHGNDFIYGYYGDDDIGGCCGHDIVYGEANVDTIRGWYGEDTLSGGSGIDTISGGPDNDEIYGGSGNDWLHGNNGVDFIDGEGGNDLVDGGEENDTLVGGAGNDDIWGRAGDDIIYGDGEFCNETQYPGEDYVRAGNGMDEVFGCEGDDTLVGGNDIDILDGGDGEDTMFGDAITICGGFWCCDETTLGFDDTLIGGEDSDWMVGCLGKDKVYGGMGYDYLWGGYEFVAGQPGDDVSGDAEKAACGCVEDHGTFSDCENSPYGGLWDCEE